MSKSKAQLSIISIDNGLSRHDSEVNEDLAKKFQRAGREKVSIADFMEDFLAQFVSASTTRAYMKDLEIFFKFLRSGAVRIEHPKDIGSHHFQIYRDSMIEQGLSSATINRRLVCIRSFIKWALAKRLIEYNPLDAVKLPKVETESPTLAFDDHEVVAMIQAPDVSSRIGNTHRMVLVMLFTLGLRRSELAQIKVKDFYQERGHYVIRIQGKGGKDRHLPLNPSIINEMQAYLDRLLDHDIHLSNEDYFIQTIPKGRENGVNKDPIDGSTIFRIIERYKKELGITKRLSPHSCRATAISHLLDTQKTPIRDVAIFAGHAKITTTERYDKRRQGLDDSAAYNVNYYDEKKLG